MRWAASSDTLDVMPGKAKRTTLPRDFEDLLKARTLGPLKEVFEKCDVNARGGSAKHTALAFDACPDRLARWLVAQGADLSATDTWGNTPLHSRAQSWRGSIDVLLELGANANARAPIGTPLHAAGLRKNSEIAKKLLAHGAKVDAKDRGGKTPLELGVGLRKALLDLGVKARKVQLVHFPEFSPVRGVHGVEPVYELVS